MPKVVTAKDIITGGFRPTHVAWEDLNLYMRRTRRFLGGKIVETAEVATISTENPGQGTGRRFFDFLEAEAQQLGLWVFVESILNPRFKEFLLRRGYIESETDNISVYLPCKE